MTAKNVLAFGVSLLVAAAVLAQGAGEAKAKSAPKAASGAVFMQAADLKWVEIDPKIPGNMIADLWGDHTKGAYGAMFKFSPGFSAPLHTHTHAMKVVIVSGTFIHTPEGKPEVRLGPGSYFLQPGGNYRHSTGCDKASECIFFAESSGKFDLKPVDAGKAPAAKK